VLPLPRELGKTRLRQLYKSILDLYEIDRDRPVFHTKSTYTYIVSLLRER